MKKDCRLIATLPNIHNKNEVIEMLSNPYISEVRLNSGVNDLLTEKEIVELLKSLEEKYHKKIWIDLKGRQLRITSWADPYYDAIELNHQIELEYPAKIYFRGSNEAEIVHTRGNKIFLDKPPEKAVGKGQSVNIIAKSLAIKGYLTEKDKLLIEESKKVGLNSYMASFVESLDDLSEILSLNPKADIISKIESLKGIELILQNNYLHLMAARDDLYIETGRNIRMLRYLKEIIKRDPSAICASKIFSSLNNSNSVSLSDYEDLELMHSYGYRNYMLGDDIRGPKLTKAIKAWKEFINE